MNNRQLYKYAFMLFCHNIVFCWVKIICLARNKISINAKMRLAIDSWPVDWHSVETNLIEKATRLAIQLEAFDAKP